MLSFMKVLLAPKYTQNCSLFCVNLFRFYTITVFSKQHAFMHVLQYAAGQGYRLATPKRADFRFHVRSHA